MEASAQHTIPKNGVTDINTAVTKHEDDCMLKPIIFWGLIASCECYYFFQHSVKTRPRLLLSKSFAQFHIFSDSETVLNPIYLI